MNEAPFIETRTDLLARAQVLLNTEPSFARFLRATVESTDPEDLKAHSADLLEALFRKSYSRLGKRELANHRIYFMPAEGPGHPEIIDIFSADMPFIVDSVLAAIRAKGGEVRLNEPALHVNTVDGKVTGVSTAQAYYPADAVISTVPTPLIGMLVPALPEASKAAYDAIANIGVICVVLKLKKAVTPHFWVNIVEPDMPIPGIIEFSNLRAMPGGETVVYVPYYMPVTNPLWQRPDDVFVAESLACLRRINPATDDSDLLVSQVGRLKHAQPVCPPGFAATLPPVQTPIAGLQIADTCFYYPEDRGIAESIRLGEAMAAAIAT